MVENKNITVLKKDITIANPLKKIMLTCRNCQTNFILTTIENKSKLIPQTDVEYCPYCGHER